MDPKIYLAIDNCFAIKRWITPIDWSNVVRKIGLKYVECVTDNELDPLLMDGEYLKDWVGEVQRAEQQTGVKVIFLYTGNGTYDTTGLAHPDERVRKHILDKWFQGLLAMGARLEVGVGYFVHAFNEHILQDKDLYFKYTGIVEDSLVALNLRAKKLGCPQVAIEQMYSPHQIPFTIENTKRFMREVGQRSGMPLYFTEDVAHHQPKFIRPTVERIQGAFQRYLQDGYIEIWLGSPKAYDIFEKAAPLRDQLKESDLDRIMKDMDDNPHLFAEKRDADCYEWLAEMGCYSPVIHLQQTDGTFSAHKPFTDESNQDGIIKPAQILKALAKSYEKPLENDLPKQCEDIYLTFEFYAKTDSINQQIIYDYQRSVEYWRKYVPEDGMRLSELVAALSRS